MVIPALIACGDKLHIVIQLVGNDDISLFLFVIPELNFIGDFIADLHTAK